MSNLPPMLNDDITHDIDQPIVTLDMSTFHATPIIIALSLLCVCAIVVGAFLLQRFLKERSGKYIILTIIPLIVIGVSIFGITYSFPKNGQQYVSHDEFFASFEEGGFMPHNIPEEKSFQPRDITSFTYTDPQGNVYSAIEYGRKGNTIQYNMIPDELDPQKTRQKR